MRIGNQQIIDLTEYQINAAYDQLAQAQTVLSTGKRINTPSDDPVGATEAMELQGQLSESNQFTTTVNDTLSWLQTTDTALSSVGNALIQARSIAVEGANGTLTQDQQQALAANVTQLLQQAVQASNSTYNGRYVLSGYRTNTQPFTMSGNTVTYQGDGGAIQREISPGQYMQINTPGNQALPAVFSSLSQLVTDLNAGNTSAVSGDIQTIDSAHDGLLLAQATVGASENRITAEQTTLQSTQTTLTGQISQLVDADMAQAAITFSTRQATYQAALNAASKVLQPSLLDFLK